MSPNRRIFLNILLTYGRSLYALVIGLFCGRWTLMALGEVDYGLNGLVGGLTCFISFINIALSGAISRYYAFTIGAETVADNKDEAIEECRHWFNIALFIHTLVPTVLICVGYPIGAYAVSHWLTIPADRISDCICVLRCTVISCYLGMVSVPFVAMYNAKQYIAELTIYSFVTSTLNAIFLYYMVTHPGLWLLRFAIFTCLLAVVPQIIICARAMTIFPECKVCVRYMVDKKRMSKVGMFAGWHFYGLLCDVLRSQGVSILINKLFGATMNAAQAIGNTMQGHCTTLSGAMQSAFMPVITQACGAKDYVKMNEYALRTCKFNLLFSLVFMIPLALELPEVLRLWLKSPPAYAAGLCYCAMALYLVGSCTMGHIVVVNAMGRIALFHAVLYTIDIFTIPIAVIVGYATHNVYAIMISVVIVMSFNSFGRVFFARTYAKTSISAWLFGIMFPVAFVTLCSFGIGLITRMFMHPSFFRICCTTCISLLFFIPASWCFIFSQSERNFVWSRFPPWLRVKCFCQNRK